MTSSPERTGTAIIGGGQSGLAISHALMERGHDHVVLEREQRLGETWRRRWDSFTLVTPSWTLQLPGHAYDGDDPDGFLTREQVVGHIEDYAAAFDPPLRLGAEVTAVDRRADDGFLLRTTEGDVEAANVVVATGTFQRPKLPVVGQQVPTGITQLHSHAYRNPDELPEGAVLVVGSGQSGCQIAQELHDSGRVVHLSVGRAGRLPRRYRGRDGMWWASQLGMMDDTLDDLDSPEQRFAANPQVSGRDGGRDVNLHLMARDGIVLLGHLEDVKSGVAGFAPDLHESLSGADEMAAKFRKGVDTYVDKAGLDAPEETVTDPQDGYEVDTITEIDLAEADISTVLWATGFSWDYRWLPAALDAQGYPVQDRGVTEEPGLYFVGLHFLHTRKSGLFLGVGQDAEHVADHITQRRAG